MIAREEVRQLAEFECCQPGEFAISFYFHPEAPTNKSHREEAIYAKDMVRRTIQELELAERGKDAIGDLRRILEVAERLHGNQARGKAVFACSARNLWREFDLPAPPLSSRLFVNRRFHLNPIAALYSDYPRLCAAIVDRQNASFLDIEFDQVRRRKDSSATLPRQGRSDGFGGYDAGHSQRHVEDEVRKHFSGVAEYLKGCAERRQFEALVVGCSDVNWPEFEARLHPEVKKKMIGRFSGELSAMSEQRAAEEANRVLADSLRKHHEAMLRTTVDEAKSNGRGATGLRRVLRATEQGEVETIIMSREYTARAVECSNCRHLDSHLVPYCPVCGRATRQLDDVCEALVPLTIKNNISLVLLPSNELLDGIGNIAASLRFRADQNTNSLRAAS
jgi:peptide subunit release factor 1 (eRF1)